MIKKIQIFLITLQNIFCLKIQLFHFCYKKVHFCYKKCNHQNFKNFKSLNFLVFYPLSLQKSPLLLQKKIFLFI